MLRWTTVLLLALGLLVATSAPAAADAGPSAKAAKKKCKKGKKSAAAAKKKCKKPPPAQSSPSPAPGGASSPPPPLPDTRTTEQKIDDAVAGGEITSEQGLTYKVFAGFGDPRLPGQYAGAPDPLAEAPLDDVTAQWNQLSDGAKATLGPFLIPPFHEGSYWEQLIGGATPSAVTQAAATGPQAADPSSPWCEGDLTIPIALQDWSYVEADSGPAAGKVRIWYQNRFAATDAALAGNLMTTMETKVWPSLTGLMGREPLPDNGSTGLCAGGSDAVDIALVDAAHATTAGTLNQENTPAHMLFPRAGSGATGPYLAHEFMHMIQYSFSFASGDMSSGENAWLKEGTAQWVQDFVSSSHYGIGLTPNQTEHQALPGFFLHPEAPLDSTSGYAHDYSTYIFWLWAARKGNDPSVVRQVWNAVGTQKSLNAARSVFGSGWAQAWKDFTRANWNQDPVGDYQDWDDIHETPTVAAEGNLPNSFTAQNVLVAPVAAKYVTFTPAADVNVLTYRNVGPLSDEAGVQAIITYKDGSHATEDWSQVAQQDVPMCNLQKLTLVFSNASVTEGDNKLIPISWTPGPAGAPHGAVGPRAANVCIPNPQGSFSGSATYDDGFTTLNYSWSGTVDFDPNGQINPWFTDYFTELWDYANVATGSATVSGSGTSEGSDGDCSIDIHTTTGQLGPGDGTMAIQPGAQPHYGIDLGYTANQLLEATFTCPDMDPFDAPISPPGRLIYTPDPEQTNTRGTYVGTSSISTPQQSANYSWNLVDP
jgi:hypothetical protein